MPDDKDVRWSFWVDINVYLGGNGPGWIWEPGGNGFFARVEGDDETKEFSISMKHVFAGGSSTPELLFMVDTSDGNWEAEELDMGHSWLVTSENLNTFFEAGESLTISFHNQLHLDVSGDGVNVNAPSATVDDLRPVPELSSLAIWSLLGAISILVCWRRCKA